jgi:hypothetical protein
MKTPSSIAASLFKQDFAEQPIRLIKAAQAGKFLAGGGHSHATGPAEPHKKPEIRLIQTGADYCDLEIVCGCGESTQVRCWNSPSAQEKVAA